MLVPPDDCRDSDRDDAPTDEAGSSGLRNVRKGIQKQRMEVYAVIDKDELELNSSKHQRECEEDDISLAVWRPRLQLVLSSAGKTQLLALNLK